MSYRNGRRSVRIAEDTYDTYKDLRAYLLEIASHRSAERLEAEFRSLRYEPYALVRRQLFGLLKGVNQVRKSAGFAPVENSCIRIKPILSSAHRDQ